MNSSTEHTAAIHAVHATKPEVHDQSASVSPADLLAALAGDRLLTPQEVAFVLGVSRQQAYSRRFKAALGSVTILGSVRYRLSAVQRALQYGVSEFAEVDGEGAGRDE